MKVTALIMAGGRGERFWPKSRKYLPKQFLSLTNDGKTMIQLTVERILPLVNIEDIFIVTNKEYYNLALEQLSEIPRENVLCEPVGRNTAPCVGIGAAYISKKYEDAVMMVLPSDHLIKYNVMFANTLKDACNLAEENHNLVTIGITPTYPETGYGYIKFNADENDTYTRRAYKVDSFVEKPNLENAEKYLMEENYLWNSGMFVWKASTILDNIKKFMPEAFTRLMTIKSAIGTVDEERVLEEEFELMESESIDYGIMEKADNIYIIPGTFGWDDVGSWLAISRIKSADEEGNVLEGNVIPINTKNCIIEGREKLIAAVGMEDVIIVDTDDTILICDKKNTGDIKKVIENLKTCNRLEYI